jgi:hypothetical protein
MEDIPDNTEEREMIDGDRGVLVVMVLVVVVVVVVGTIDCSTGVDVLACSNKFFLRTRYSSVLKPLSIHVHLNKLRLT